MAERMKILFKRCLSFLLIALLSALCLCACNAGKDAADIAAKDEVNRLETEIVNSKYVSLAVTSAEDNADATLTASVAPQAAAEMGLTWEIFFNDPSSEWANGKTVTDYVTLTTETENALSAVLTCLQPFGEPIIVKATSVYNPEYFATCTLGFEKKVEDVRFTLYYDGEELDSVLYSEMKAGTVNSEYFDVAYIGTDGYNAKDWAIDINVDFTEEEKQYELKVEGIFSEAFTKDRDFSIEEYAGSDKYGDNYSDVSYNLTPDGFFVADAYVTLIEPDDEAQAFVDKLKGWMNRTDLTGFYADVEEYNSVYFKHPLTLESTPQGELVFEKPFGDWRDVASEIVTSLRILEETGGSLTESIKNELTERLDSAISAGSFEYMGETITFDDEITSVAEYFARYWAAWTRIRYRELEKTLGTIFDISLHFNSETLPPSLSLDPSEIIF